MAADVAPQAVTSPSPATPNSTRAISTRRLLEGWKHDVRNVWWIVDYNRQSLDSVVQDRLFGRFEGLFGDMGWNVVRIKHGRLQEAAFAQPGGEALRRWIDECPNSLYASLTFQGGEAWRTAILADLGRADQALRAIIDPAERQPSWGP